MNENQFHILLQVPETFSENLEETISEIDHDKLLIVGVKKPPEVWSGLEWALPGLIVVYIAKSYFEGFLQEMGKDHYDKLKIWLKKILLKSKDSKVTTFSVGEKKIDPSNTQSKAISIFIELSNGQKIKLLFDEELSLNEWNKAIDSVLELILENYQNPSEDELGKKLINLNSKPYYTIYGFIDRDNNSWRFIDDSKLIQIQRELADKKEKKRKKEKRKKK